MTPLDAYIRQDGIQYFTGPEIVQSHKGTPAQSMWPNILGALRIADAIRVAYGAPVRVVSRPCEPTTGATHSWTHTRRRWILRCTSGKLLPSATPTRRDVTRHLLVAACDVARG
jgi:hypothetical protein